MASRFTVDPWGVVVRVRKRLPKGEEASPQTFGLVWVDEDGELLINVWFSPALLGRSPRGDKAAELERERTRDSIVVHETVHIVQFLEQAVSAKLDRESQAYLTAWLVDKIKSVLKIDRTVK